jgi:hypothetical protein
MIGLAMEFDEVVGRAVMGEYGHDFCLWPKTRRHQCEGANIGRVSTRHERVQEDDLHAVADDVGERQDTSELAWVPALHITEVRRSVAVR